MAKCWLLLVQDEDEMIDTENLAANGGDIVESGQPGMHTPAEANKDRITTPYMTKYEKARILGTRALQIS